MNRLNSGQQPFPERDEPEKNALELLTPLASWAKPTAGGLAWNTEYTFLRNVSPTIQDGTSELVPTVLPMSKIPPAHIWVEPLWLIVPRFISAVLMGQVLPPKERETVTSVSHAVYHMNPVEHWK